MAKKPTLVDVSRASGLSVYTVSRALSSQDGVSAESRAAVLTAARDLGYVPNRAAQELRKNTRSAVAILTASTSNYYYIDLMEGIQRTLRASGRSAVVADLAVEGVYTAEAEDAMVQNVIQSRMAGVISTLTLSPQSIRLLEQWDIPVVFVDSKPAAEAGLVASVTTDNFAASQQVGNHLAGHGYDDWLLLIYPARWSTRMERERGMREAAAQHGARLVVIESENDADHAYQALTAHLDAPSGAVPRALIAGNNPMLRGALHALRDRGVRVPLDCAVVAFDEFAWAPLLDPPLTVLNEHSEQIGLRAATILTRLIDDQVTAEQAGQPLTPVYRPDDRQEVEAELIVRRSCGC